MLLALQKRYPESISTLSLVGLITRISSEKADDTKRISLIATILLDIKALLKDRTGEYEVYIGRDGFNAKLGMHS